ncbi:MAG: methylated-DNA--[protein]-cysteine S-methyltransferase [Fibrobacter sp.]|nr:methylated-DNA--[protein]-cysteine S-methyltransferase [Fibrobacter sp.]
MRHSDFVTIHTDLTNANRSVVKLQYQTVSTPFGIMIIGGDADGLRLCDFVIDPTEYITQYKLHYPEVILCQRESSLLSIVQSFLLDPKVFHDHIPIIVSATEFQVAVWKSVLEIPWGDTSTYTAIAADAGYTGAVRAAGTAIGKNPVLFVIPCHRVVLSNGKCGNYLRGVEKKKTLLDYEFTHKE